MESKKHVRCWMALKPLNGFQTFMSAPVPVASGKTLRLGVKFDDLAALMLTVVGVVGDVKAYGLDREAVAQVIAVQGAKAYDEDFVAFRWQDVGPGEVGAFGVEERFTGRRDALIGTLVHRCLELIAREGLEHWSADRIRPLEATYQRWLTQAGHGACLPIATSQGREVS